MPGSGKKQSQGFRNIQISSAVKRIPNHFWETTRIHWFGELSMLVTPNTLKVSKSPTAFPYIDASGLEGERARDKINLITR